MSRARLRWPRSTTSCRWPWAGPTVTSSASMVVRLRQDLPLEQIGAAPTLHNARALLALLDEEDGLGATQSGNLNRAAVALLLKRLRWPEGYLEELHKYNKVIDERDAWRLHAPWSFRHIGTGVSVQIR
jgi:hypothetical protein